MSDLSEGGKALVQAVRRADRPSDADRKRVLAALQARLGDAALLGAGVTEAPRAAASGARWVRSRFLKWGFVGSTVLVAGAALFVPRFGHEGEKAVPSAVVSVASAAAPPVAVLPAAPELPPVPSPQNDDPGAKLLVAPEGASRSTDAQKPPSRSRGGLTEEVALLSRAETELHAGRPAKALVALAEHQRKFPRGALAEERTAAKIQALCALGRNEEANTQLRQLLHISPKSALEERSRQACR
ncbi:MAG TPA: hypothetical protein VHM25_09575 [Polyangiaceae bacterium]|jgi:hypothetical protein|nr:hypothetical protein [Polyangiaceae bacterium]